MVLHIVLHLKKNQIYSINKNLLDINSFLLKLLQIINNHHHY